MEERRKEQEQKAEFKRIRGELSSYTGQSLKVSDWFSL